MPEITPLIVAASVPSRSMMPFPFSVTPAPATPTKPVPVKRRVPVLPEGNVMAAAVAFVPRFACRAADSVPELIVVGPE